jgi:hypothetical protein
MKVIFVDNDGVICLSNNWGSRNEKQRKFFTENNPRQGVDGEIPLNCKFDNFDVKAIKVLNEILIQTDAEIIVSSDWRYYATLEELGEYYTSQGICKKPIGFTPFTKDVNPKWWNSFSYYAMLETERVIEIKSWLENHPEVTHWVAVDDLNLGIYEPVSGDIFNDNGLTNFVHTRKADEGIKQTGIKEKILQYLI